MLHQHIKKILDKNIIPPDSLNYEILDAIEKKIEGKKFSTYSIGRTNLAVIKRLKKNLGVSTTSLEKLAKKLNLKVSIKFENL